MIERLEADERLVVRWRDGLTTEFPWIWVRDHSHDPATLHPVTLQRLTDPLDVDPRARPAAVQVVDDVVMVEWGDGSSPAELPIEILRGRNPADTSDDTHGPARHLWDATTLDEQAIRTSHASVLEGDDGVRALLDRVHRFGFSLIEDVPTSIAAAETLLRRIGYVRETIFGGMWEFTSDLAKADTAYTSIALRPHTDGTYSHDAPGLQLLLCLAFDGSGGETVLVDGFHLADVLCATDPAAFDTLTAMPVTGRYIGDGVDLRASRPPIRLDRGGRLVQVSYNTADRAPFHLPPAETDRVYAALRAFGRLTDDPSTQWRHTLRPGQAVLLDNWRVLHGRAAFTGHRHLCGGYVNREDYESRRRVLASIERRADR